MGENLQVSRLASTGAYGLASLRVPQPENPILIATDHLRCIRGPAHALNPVLVPLPHAFAFLQYRYGLPQWLRPLLMHAYEAFALSHH